MLFQIIFIKQKKNTSCFMEFLKKYTSHEEYEVDKTPNVSLCVENNEKHLHYTKKKFDDEYLTFEALESGTFTLTINSGVTTGDVVSVSYSLDNGETWTTTNNVQGQKVTITTPTVNAGDEVLWKGNANRMANNIYSYSVSTFSSTANFNARGNIMSLLYGDEFKDKNSLSGKNYCFCYLFNINTKIINGKNISLPATTLAQYCYHNMFRGTSLTVTPELPATTLAQSCYYSMFYGCKNLTTAPKLTATTLAQNCYYEMFSNCTSITTPPELPATTLAIYCYSAMFYGCTSLTIAPELPATTLAQNCYQYMFDGCTSLTVAPELPATTLTYYCYSYMFYKCTSLTVTPELPATTLAEGCYSNMFNSCTSLTTAPTLSASTLMSYCYRNMFSGCTNLNLITCLATDISATGCTLQWVNGVADSGTFTKAANMTGWVLGKSGIPCGWNCDGEIITCIVYDYYQTNKKVVVDFFNRQNWLPSDTDDYFTAYKRKNNVFNCVGEIQFYGTNYYMWENISNIGLNDWNRKFGNDSLLLSLSDEYDDSEMLLKNGKDFSDANNEFYIASNDEIYNISNLEKGKLILVEYWEGDDGIIYDSSLERYHILVDDFKGDEWDDQDKEDYVNSYCNMDNSNPDWRGNEYICIGTLSWKGENCFVWENTAGYNVWLLTEQCTFNYRNTLVNNINANYCPVLAVLSDDTDLTVQYDASIDDIDSQYLLFDYWDDEA